MQPDKRGLPITTDSPDAAASIDRAVEHSLKFHADTMAVLNDALAENPAFVLGHVFKCYLLLSASNAANAPPSPPAWPRPALHGPHHANRDAPAYGTGARWLGEGQASALDPSRGFAP
jgi:hypothetical protein